MTEHALFEKLKTDGYRDFAVEEFEPDTIVAEHIHDQDTIQVFVKGEITVTDPDGKATKYKAGDAMVSPAGTKHRAKSGQGGCKFVVGYR